MDFHSLATQLRGWKRDMKKALEAGTKVPAEPGSPEWYAGLAVSPASFSRQLGDMQKAMQAANKPDDSRISVAR